MRPKLIVLSVNQEKTAELMKGFAAELANVRGKPRLAYAGRYFDYNEQARRDLGGIYLGKTLAEALEKMKQLIMLV